MRAYPSQFLRECELLHLKPIHPQKVIDHLLQAHSLVAPKFPSWRLRIVGPSESGHSAEREALARLLSLDDSVYLETPPYSADKQEVYRRALL